MQNFTGCRFDKPHWLLISQRIEYKLSALVTKCLHQTAPPYLTEYCVFVSSDINRKPLRSAACNYLMLLRVNLSQKGSRSFHVSGQKTWNQLPDNVRDATLTERQFYKLLKTTSFRRAYYQCSFCTLVLDICK